MTTIQHQTPLFHSCVTFNEIATAAGALHPGSREKDFDRVIDLLVGFCLANGLDDNQKTMQYESLVIHFAVDVPKSCCLRSFLESCASRIETAQLSRNLLVQQAKAKSNQLYRAEAIDLSKFGAGTGRRSRSEQK